MFDRFSILKLKISIDSSFFSQEVTYLNRVLSRTLLEVDVQLIFRYVPIEYLSPYQLMCMFGSGNSIVKGCDNLAFSSIGFVISFWFFSLPSYAVD